MKKKIIFVLILALVLVAGYVAYVKYAKGNAGIVGTWQLESMASLNEATGTLDTIELKPEEKAGYITQYTADGKFCDMWTGEQGNECGHYSDYKTEGNELKLIQEGVTESGPSKITFDTQNGKLNIKLEAKHPTTGEWVTLLTQTLVKIK